MARRSYSEQNAIRKLIPLVFEKAGSASVAAFGGRKYNLGGSELEVKKIHVSCVGAPAGSALTIDVKINGTTVFAATGDRASIATTNTAQVIEVVPTKTGEAILVRPGQYVTVEATSVGSGTAATDVVVSVVLG